MVYSRWTLCQSIIIILLIAFSFIADLFKKDIGVPFNSTAEIQTPMIFTSLFLVTIIALLSLLMYFQVKKSDTFLRHRLWDKMYIIMPVIILFSLIVMVVLFLIEPISEMIQLHRWIIYVLFYYILFLINVTVLAFIHKAKRNMVSNESKIGYSFVWTSLGLLVVIFIV